MAEAILEDLAEAFNDTNKKAKARTLYRNLRMNESERLKTFLSKSVEVANMRLDCQVPLAYWFSNSAWLGLGCCRKF